MADNNKSLLLVFRRAPYGTGLARAGYDLALASAAFDQPVSLLFMDDGVWQLMAEQQAAGIDAKSIANTLASLPLYDIETLYVEADSLSSRGLEAEELSGNLTLLTAMEIGDFMNRFDRVVSF